jgi:AsmA protein
MKKLLKVAGIVVGILILLMIGLSIVVKSYLSSDRLKPIILPRAEAMTGRKVQLDEINVSLFRGVVAKGLSVKEKDGKGDFLKIGRFVLSYRLLPLLKKELVISKIEIISPSISIEKERGGEYNFTDIMEKSSHEPQKPQKPSTPERQALPVSIIADRLIIRNASLTFVDEGKELPDVSATFDADFKGGLEKDGTPRMDFGRISLKEIKAELKDAEIKVSGKIDMDAKAIRADLQTMIGKDRIEVSATAKDYRSAPDVLADIHAKTLDLQYLTGLSGEKKTREDHPRQKEKKAEPPGRRGMTQKLKASGQITIDKATYQDYTIKDLRVHYQYAKGMMRVDPIGLQFSGEGSFTAEGSLNGNLQFGVDGVSSIQKTLRGVAVAKLGKGAIKQSQIFDAIALLTGIPSLKNPGFDEGLFNFDVKDERVFLDGWIRSPLFKVSPKGVVDFDKRLDIPTELKLAPTLTGSLKGRVAALKLLEDEQGWKVIPLKIKGTTEKPNVNLDEGALGKQLGRGLTKELERRLLERKPKDSGEPSGETKPKDMLKELFGK